MQSIIFITLSVIIMGFVLFLGVKAIQKGLNAKNNKEFNQEKSDELNNSISEELEKLNTAISPSMQDINNYIRQSAGSFKIAADNFDLATTTISMSNAGGGRIALGSSEAPKDLSSNGIYFSGSGDFNLQGSTTNYIRRTGTALDIKAGTFDLDATTLILDSGTNSGVIKLGPSGGPGSATGTSNGGVYVDGTGKFNLVGDADNYIRFNATGLEINTENLTMDSSGNVVMAGQVTADAGSIGGWSIANDFISGSNLIIDSAGKIETANYVSNFKGFRLSAEGNGFLEVENAKIRGTLKTTVFEKETVNAVGGQLYVANSTTITGSLTVSASATTMSVANASGFTGSYTGLGGEIVSLKKVTSTGFQTEYVYVQSASRLDPASDTDMRGFLYVTRSYNQGLTGDSGSLGDFAQAATTYEPGQVLVSTGRSGSGYIRLNANPNDTTTPYIDIVERTGSGVYDVDLKARLGDLSGLSSAMVHGERSPGFGLYSGNVFLTGGIVANTGSIAGIKMQSGKLFIGAGNHGNADTAFYADSSGQFSLKNKLTWDGDDLVVVGQITVVSGQVHDQMVALGNATSSLFSQANSLGDATSSLQSQANTLGVATASLSQGSASMAAVATLTGTGLAIKNASGQLLSDFGGNIHMGGIGGTIYVGVTGSAGDWVEIDSTSIDIMRNNVSVGSWADSTFRVGAAASEHIEIDSGGMRVNDGTTMLSKFGSNIHLNSGTIYVGVTGSSADWVQLDSTAIEIIRNNVSVAQFADSSLRLGADANNSSFVEIGTNSMNFIVDSSGTNATKASFGANTTITGGEITIQGTTGADGHEKLKIWAGNIGIYTNNARRIAIDDDGIAIGRSGSADTTTSTTAHQVTINNNGVYSYHNAQNYSHVGANGLKIYQNFVVII